MIVLQRMKHVFFYLCIMLLAFAQPAFAANTETQQPTVKEISTVIGDNAVRYPQLEGLTDEKTQQAINNAIVEKAKIAQRMVTLTTLKSGSAGLQVQYEAYVDEGVFSTVISAFGILENGRSGQEYTTLNYNLSDGRELTFADFFADPDTAAEDMETILQNTLGEDLSAYLVNASLTPLPRNNFSFNADGITFYYPADQFSLLSGYCGAAQFTYWEVTSDLISSADGLPARLGAFPEPLNDAEMKQNIIETVEKGTLPQIPVTIGDAMTDLVKQYRLVRQPDQYPGGKYYQLEAPAFRQVLVLSDALTNGYEQSKAEGLLSFRTNLFGLQTGVASQKRWREVLGEPDSTVSFDEAMAYDYGLPVGTADYYTFGNRQLLMYADENGILYAVRISD